MTIPTLVGLMCNFSVAMPENFTLMFEFEEGLEQEPLERSGEDSVTTEVPRVPPTEVTYAEGNCSVNIYALTTPAPTTPSEPTGEAVE
uniref:Putative anticomplement protein ixac-b2 n=1 Tax=Ixodes ricinus TaxID=34613 RepID=V5HBC7_IXORI